MSDELKKLLEGLPIKVLDKDCAEIDGGRYVRSEIKHWADNAGGTGQRLGWRTLLRVMDEYEESAPVNPGREFEELKNYTIQECGKGIELKLTWEPGTVIRNANGMMLLLNEPGAQYLTGTMWNTTNMQDGLTADLILSPELWEVYRLPHEFKVGDWFDCESEGIFQCFRMPQPGVIEATNTNLYNPARCRHVPAPRKKAIAELARQEMADGHYTCDPVKEPKSETDIFVPMPPKSERPVTMKVQREDPFTGAHWDERQDADSATLHLRALQRDCDLRDEVRRLKER